MPLSVLRCLPHTSWIGFFAAFSSNALPYLGEIIYLYYYYNVTTYVDHQTEVPSIWFRWWRPGFIIVGILYDVGMLTYCIYMGDVFTVLLAVRVTVGFYQLGDQIWMIKHWVPFFVQKEKRKLIFIRLFLVSCAWFLLVGSTSWSGSWQERNDIFANVYYFSIVVSYIGNGLWYLFQGGNDLLVKYRFHCARNVFAMVSFCSLIFGTVGLIIGDGGGNNLVEIFKYHSIFTMIYFAIDGSIMVVVQLFIVFFEELSWKYPNPISSPSTHGVSNEATMLQATNGILSASNKVACGVDVPSSSNEGARMGNTVIEVAPSENHINVVVTDDINPSHHVEGKIEEDGKEVEDVEAAHGLVSQSAATSPPATELLTGAGSIVVPYKSRRRFALVFDSITRRSSILRRNILTHYTKMSKLKRHELLCIELDKLFSVLYQMLIWEVVIWLAQIFLTLYLHSVDTPIPPGHAGYYCQTPLENTVNSAQFVNDFVFARRR